MATTDLGKIGITPKGAWGGGKTYERLDAVEHLGASYLALRDTEAEPTKDSPDWMLLAEGISTEGVEGIIDTRFEGLSAVATSGAYADLSGAPTSLQASGGDADTVDGFHASKENVANTEVVRGNDGSVHVGAVISDTPNDENLSISQIITTNGSDNYYRKASLTHIKNSLYLNYSYTFVCYHPDRSGYTDLLEIDSRYSAHPILLEVAKRGGGVVRIYAVLKDEDIVVFRRTPVLGSVDPNGYKDSPSVYLAKTATYKYDLYIHMPNGYGMTVVHVLSGAAFKVKNIIQSSLPTGYIVPTEVAYIP